MDHFRKRVTRKVDKDRTISLNGRLYEAPLAMIGRTVTLAYHEADPARIELFSNGTSYGMLVPLDVHVNVRIRRTHDTVDIIPAGDPTHYRGGRVFEEEP